MTEMGWWYTGLFFVIIIVFYTVGFFLGKGWENQTWQDKIEQQKNQQKQKNPRKR